MRIQKTDSIQTVFKATEQMITYGKGSQVGKGLRNPEKLQHGVGQNR